MLFFVTFILVLLQVLLRNQKAAIAASIILYGLSMGAGNPLLIGIWMLLSALFWLMLVRFGLVAAVFFGFAYDVFNNLPVTLDASTWLAGYGFASLAIFAAVVLYAFRTSVGGRPLLASSRLDE